MDNNEEVLLPTRDFLRQLIGQTKVKNVELKNVLRARGVFTGSDQKEVVGPILIKTGLSPFEYVDLRESYRTRKSHPNQKRGLLAGTRNRISLIHCRKLLTTRPCLTINSAYSVYPACLILRH